MYKTLKRENIYKGRIIDVKRDSVLLPNGKETIREVVLHSAACGMVAIDDEGMIILVRQYRYPASKEMLELPAGLVEPGEPPEKCALRELEEETSYKAENISHLTSFYTSAGFSDEVLHIYLCTGLKKGRMKLDEDEILSAERFTPEEVCDMIFSGEITDSKTIIGILMYRELLRRQK